MICSLWTSGIPPWVHFCVHLYETLFLCPINSLFSPDSYFFSWEHFLGRTSHKLSDPKYNENDNFVQKLFHILREPHGTLQGTWKPSPFVPGQVTCLWSRSVANSTSSSLLSAWPGNCLPGCAQRQLESYISPFSVDFIFFFARCPSPGIASFLPHVSCLSYLVFSGRRQNPICVSESCTEAVICSVHLFKDPSRYFFIFGQLAWYLA